MERKGGAAEGGGGSSPHQTGDPVARGIDATASMERETGFAAPSTTYSALEVRYRLGVGPQGSEL